MDADLLKAHLRDLQRNGHVRFTGTNRWGAWSVTSTLPADEPPPVWMIDHGDEPPDEPTPQQAATQADKVLAAARFVPCSVFALGGQAAGFGVDIDAVHMPAEHKAAMVAPVDPAVAPVWSVELLAMPAAAPAPTPKPPPQLPPEPAAEPTLDQAPEPLPELSPEPAEAATAARGLFSLFTLGDGPLFALRSDYRLLVRRQSGDELLFSPDETRALFRYLDSLMAIGHGSLSEATS